MAGTRCPVARRKRPETGQGDLLLPRDDLGELLAIHLIFTGLGSTPTELVTAFEDLLLTPTEALVDQRSWDVLEDGLEPWLGDIRDVA